MSDNDRVISQGPFKGKKISSASTERVEAFDKIAREFMGEIFDFLPGECLITDESDVSDFTEYDTSDTSEIWERIRNVYNIDKEDVGSDRLVEIFTEIERRRSIQ